MLTLAAVVVIVIVAMIGAFFAAAMIIGMISLALTVLERLSAVTQRYVTRSG